jgi:hypothetical protein
MRSVRLGRRRLASLARWSPWVIALGTAWAVGACSQSSHRPGPPQKPLNRLKFSHKTHAEEADCTDCHEGIEKAKSPPMGRLIPKDHTPCEDCHEDELDEKKCNMCHVGKPKKEPRPSIDRHLKFSHEAHLKRTKSSCKECHPRAYTAAKPGIELVPDMAGCVNRCHNDDMAQMNCERCHRDLHRYRLRPTTRLAHEGGFIRRHGAFVRSSSRCHICHDQTYCADCHARTAAMPLSVRFPEETGERFIHRGDFLGRHGASARQQPATCRKCHGSNHCMSCHELQGLTMPEPGGTTTTSRQVHGPNHMTPTAPDFHGRLARRDINRCASCHDRGAASICVSCHMVGGTGGNPHPTGFLSGQRAGDCRTDRMCLVCHTGGSACGP